MKRVGASGAAWVAMVAAVTIVAAFAASAAEKFVIALPNGYEMARAKGGAIAIAKRRGKVVVPGPIKSYVVVREVVVGQLDVPDPKDAKAPDSSAATSDAPPGDAYAKPVAPAPTAAAPPNAPPAAAPAPAGGGGKPGAAADKPAANPVFARPLPSPNGRYFVLDTKTGDVGKDLSLPEWQERLKKFDITTAPQLAAPILPK